MAKSLKNARRFALTGNRQQHTADQTALLAYARKVHPGSFKLNDAGRELFGKSKRYKVDGPRRARNAVRKLLHQGLIEMKGNGVYEALVQVSPAELKRIKRTERALDEAHKKTVGAA